MLKTIINFLFNENVGYFINEHVYYYEGQPYIGYVICQGFRFFGVYGYTRIAHAHDKQTLLEVIRRFNLPLTV